MTQTLSLEFVSDVSCPWCVIGLLSLQEAERRLEGRIALSVKLRPFELNPDMPREGQLISEHVQIKYGSSPEQSRAVRETLRSKAAALGFTMRTAPDSRIYNTFDAHRLLEWAQGMERGAALKRRLLEMYFSEGGDPSDHRVLADSAERAGLDCAEAEAVLASTDFADQVRRREQENWADGISAVPTLIVDGRYLIVGAQPAEALERAFLSIAAEPQTVEPTHQR